MDTITCYDERLSSPVPAGLESILEIRLDKVLEVQRQLNSGEYHLTEYLDIVLDRFLEDFLI